MVVLQKLKIELPYDPTISLLATYPKELKAESQRYLHIHVQSIFIHNSQEVEATQCPSAVNGQGIPWRSSG